MEDFSQALQDLLGNEEGQENLKNIANMLGAGDGNLDLSMLQDLLGGQTEEDKSQKKQQEKKQDSLNLDGLDINMLLQLKKLFDSASQEDPSANLILALKPLLGPERQKKADSAAKLLKIMKLLPLLKDSGMLDHLL